MRQAIKRLLYGVWSTGSLLAFTGLAERRPLNPPPQVEFRLEEHIAESYAAEIQAFEEIASCFHDAVVNTGTRVFRQTLDQPTLIEVAQQLESGITDYQWNRNCERTENSARDRLKQTIGEILARVRRGRYLADPLGAPIEFEVDRQRKVYRVSWHSWEGQPAPGAWTGPRTVKEVPFVPRVEVVVEATFDAGKYGYRVVNRQDSEAALSRKAIELEGYGLTPELVRMHRSVGYDQRYVLKEEHSFGFHLPTRALGNYRVSKYDGSKPWVSNPGETFCLPPLLHVPWASLPGIVSCWVPVAPWDPASLGSGLDPETDPANVVRMFSEYKVRSKTELGTSMELRFAYHGKTLGPVPVPGPDEREEFVERIRESFREARSWGWCPDADLADRLEVELARIDPARPDPDGLAQLLEAVETAAATGGLLHEAHVLLQSNLEYLADPSHWE